MRVPFELSTLEARSEMDYIVEQNSVVEWLERRAYDQRGFGSKPPRAILLCSWERHFTALSPAWWCWQAVLDYKRTATSWHLRKQVGVIAYPMY